MKTLIEEVVGRISPAGLMPFLKWRQMVTRESLRTDLMAGITGAVIVLPQGVAFAMIAGLPPEYGLYSAIVPAVIAALFGSSHHLISGPTTAISIVIFTTLSPLAPPSSPEYIRMALTLTFLAGLFQLGLGLARLGALVNFVSHSVVVGFTSGAAILIATSQLPNFLGMPGSKRHAFIHVWQDILSNLKAVNPYVLLISVTTLCVAVIMKKTAPRLPGMLVAMISGSLVAYFMSGEVRGIKLIGSLPAHLPRLSHPDIDPTSLRRLSSGALAVAMLGLTEAVSIARSIAMKSEQRIDSNQEFIGQGLANMIGSFFSSYASSGSFTRSGVNFGAGAKTPLAAVFAAVSLAAILLLIAPLTAYLPTAAMAGVLMIVAYSLIDVHHISKIAGTSRAEAGVLIITFLATLLVELEFAIYVGVMLSLFLYLNRTSHPHVVTLAPDTSTEKRSLINIERKPLLECPQLKILRLDGSIFFGAVNHIAERMDYVIRMSPEQAHILIVASGINFIDSAGCEMMASEAHRLRLNGRQVYICSLKGDALEIMKKGGCMKMVGEENIFRTKTEAIGRIVPRLDPQRCRTCRARVFNECADMPDDCV